MTILAMEAVMITMKIVNDLPPLPPKAIYKMSAVKNGDNSQIWILWLVF